jgi:hypothetical protein
MGQGASLPAPFFMEDDMKRYLGLFSLLSVMLIKSPAMGFG